MNLSNAKALLASWVDDPNFGYFTEANITAYLNNGQYEVQKLLLASGNNRYLKCVETTLVVNQLQYALPIDFMKENRLEIIASGTYPNEDRYPIFPITLNQQDMISDRSGSPDSYYFNRNKIVLVPPPSSALTMRLYYSYRVAQLVSDSDVFDVPEEYAEFPVILAAIDCIMKDGRDASVFMAKKADFEERLKRDAAERIQDRPRAVVMNGGGFDASFGGAWF